VIVPANALLANIEIDPKKVAQPKNNDFMRSLFFEKRTVQKTSPAPPNANRARSGKKSENFERVFYFSCIRGRFCKT
jgi:hypothetical protein